MNEPRKEGTAAVAAVRKHDELSDDDLSHDEELLKDRILGIADELEIIKEEKKQPGKKKAKVETRTLSDQEPTPEHLLLRETLEATVKWDKGMRDKYMAGVITEVMGKIMGHIKAKTEFPPTGSEVYPKWTKDMMDESRIGWQKHKTFFETMNKYPLQNCEQRYCPETGEWIMVDCSDLDKSLFDKKDG